MSTFSQAQSNTAGESSALPAYGGYNNIVDYILGITFEIWEQRQVGRILDYYGADIDVYSLEGITHGSASMVEQTHATLKAFPDRLLLGESVVWSGNMTRGFSSHRITSPMTNRGETRFGPATGKPLLIMNVADCEITEGRITREWLLRDNLALVSQLGYDVHTAARRLAGQFDKRFRDWLSQEFSRVSQGRTGPALTIGQEQPDPQLQFAKNVLENLWVGGDTETLESVYAPYCVMQRAPVRIFSGRPEILRHYYRWRNAFPRCKLTVDHVCSQPHDINGVHVAARWSIAAEHKGAFAGIDPHDRPVYVVGVTHWRVMDGKIIAEWTVFDELAVIAQLLDQNV
jgi:predicted ester cyclase